MKRTVFIKIIGRVQGVFFRAEAEEKAHMLGLTGWVRNTSDGAVEILAQGEEAALLQLIDWCHKGPDRAHVENVVVKIEPLGKIYSDFLIV